MDSTDSKAENVAPKQSPKRRLWAWFVVGFAIAFLATGFENDMAYLLPSGNGLVQCNLWKYYQVEIPRALRPVRTMGPNPDGTSALIVTAFQHILISSIGGVIIMGVGWGIHKIRHRR